MCRANTTVGKIGVPAVRSVADRKGEEAGLRSRLPADLHIETEINNRVPEETD